MKEEAQEDGRREQRREGETEMAQKKIGVAGGEVWWKDGPARKGGLSMNSQQFWNHFSDDHSLNDELLYFGQINREKNTVFSGVIMKALL